MNCEILRTVYIRSNGEIPCNDDLGESIQLGRIESGRDITAVLQNERYSHIRDSLKVNRAPWPDICPGCAFFHPHEPFEDLLSHKRIAKLQIEPSLACSLRCPCCSNGIQVRSRPNPLRMGVETFEETLSDLKDRGYEIGEVEYCGQGEPLLHPDFPAFVRIARYYFPAAVQRLITSGNFDYLQATRGEFIDEIFVSCDGVYPQSYEKYRVGGKVERALQFMRDAAQETPGQKQAVIWKYILFEFNDSEAEIYDAQRLAQDLNVHTLLFVFTHSAYRSQRFTAENALAFPRYFPNVVTNATPIHSNNVREVIPMRRWRIPRPLGSKDAFCVVDKLTLFGGRWLEVRGWSLARSNITAVQVSLDGQEIGNARVGFPRPDVFEKYPQFCQLYGGFVLTTFVERPLAGKCEVNVTVLSGSQEVTSYQRCYKFS